MRLVALVFNLAAGLTMAAGMGALSASAAVVNVDLELVLAVDVSRSMDYEEQKLQREGYVDAFRHPQVIEAIQSGSLGRIAVTYVEWAGPLYQAVVVPWAIVESTEDAETFSAKVAAAPMLRETGTSISGGLFFASGLFRESGVEGVRRAIDISGDGPNNMGLPVVPMRDRIVSEGITINGLPIIIRPSLGSSAFSIPNLDVYYEDCVIGGPGAFMITINDPARFSVAIRRKLVLEIAGRMPEVIPAAATSAVPRVDCLIGEKSRGNWFQFDR